MTDFAHEPRAAAIRPTKGRAVHASGPGDGAKHAADGAAVLRGSGAAVCDVQIADRRLAMPTGRSGNHRVAPVASRFFGGLGGYLQGRTAI